MRLFVGVPLPESVRARLAMLCCGLPRVRWVPPENLHLTLRFIGDADGGAFADIDAGLAGVRAPGFSVEISGVGHFGNGNRVRIVWAGAGREPGLVHLRDKVESAVVRSGFEPEGQRFSPHVTLGRGRGAPVPRLHHFLAAHALFRCHPFEVGHFVLFSSFPGSGGSIYREERSYELERT